MANIDQLVIIASQAIPVTDPFLIDRVAAIAERRGLSQRHLRQQVRLGAGGGPGRQIYTAAGFPTLKVSAETGEGMDELRQLIAGKVSAFTGNSGVGKSSILNALEPGIALATGDDERKAGPGSAHHPPCGAVPAELRGAGGRHPGVLLL